MNNGKKLANQNVIFREIYRCPDDDCISQESLLPYISLTRKLIDLYEPNQEWKNLINHPEYVFREYQIASILENKIGRTREQIISIVAWLMQVNPIVLFNDPDLPI